MPRPLAATGDGVVTAADDETGVAEAAGGSAGASAGADGWHELRVPVRFRDLDPMGHAHHSLPLVYLEEARAALWRKLQGSAALESVDYVMAEVTLRFHARIRYPGTVRVRLAVTAVGTKSFTMSFDILDEAGTLLSSGSTVQVAYDYATSSAKPLAPGLRAGLEAGAAAWRAAQNSSAMAADTEPISAPRT
jgi:acyl-CoA thioester hydrolase